MWGHQFEQEDHFAPGWEGQLMPAESCTLSPSQGTGEDNGVKRPPPVQGLTLSLAQHQIRCYKCHDG